jgi:hypothetical protein
MVAGENPLKRYLRYRSSGRLTRTEQQELTTEIIGQLHERVIALENRP